MSPDDALNICLLTARLRDDDETALEILRGKLTKVSPEEIRTTLAEWDQRRAHIPRDYVDDRAYLLLLAYHTGNDVMPVAEEDREQFEEEARLGHMPLPDAYAELVEAEPRLRQLEAVPQRLKRVNRVKNLLGPNSGKTDPLLSSETAASVAVAYLLPPATERHQNQRSYFERPQHASRGSFGI